MKKICIFLMSGLPIPAVSGGAIETLVQLLIDKNEETPRFRFVVLCAEDQKAKLLSENYTYTEFVYFKQYPFMDKVMAFVSRGMYRALRIPTPFSVGCVHALNYIKRHDFDLLVNETWKVYISPLIARVFPKEKTALHLHRKGEVGKGDISKRIDDSFGYLIPVSNFIAQDWKQYTDRKDTDIYVLRNCCDSQSMQKTITEDEKKDLRESLGIADGEKVIIFAGRITDEKGVSELVQAVSGLPMDNVRLLIIGGSRGKQMSDYEKNVEQLISKSEKMITRVGYVDNHELYKYYSISDIAVFPSKCEEAAGLTVIEAITTGMPIITTNKGGIPEYTPSDVAVHIDADEKMVSRLSKEIQRLLMDDVLRRTLAEKAITESEKYSPEIYFDSFSGIVECIEKSEKR